MFKNRSVFAWCLYDTGHCAFATIVMAVVLPVYYQNVIAGGEWALSSWGYASSVALALSAVLTPLVGTYIDGRTVKKKYLLAFAALGIAASAALAAAGPGRWFYALACMAIDTAVERHAGHLEEIYTVMGSTYMQTGKDLSNIRQVVVTGGSLIHTKRTDEIAAHALYNPEKPMSLRPGRANILVDRHYILASMGLLSEHYPTAALHIMKKELENMGEQIADASAAAVPGSGFVPVMDFADCHSGHHPED